MRRFKFDVCKKQREIWLRIVCVMLFGEVTTSSGGWSQQLLQHGAIFFIWKEDDFEVHNYFEEEGFLGLQGVCNKVDKEVIIVNVYASWNIDKRSWLWDELKNRRADSNINLWCIIGNFNCVKWQHERKGESSRVQESVESKEFNEFIEVMEVVDIPLVRRKFTWFRPNGSARSRIDRVLILEE